ncbi:uncharacterized protein [Physcomitrium patens]|uniref:uncharacterized protein isoform X2 n=1 Tax=Physcomitrium patens TaxID=3218 RepID=UPI003CCD9417
MEKAGGWTCDRMVCFVLESVAATHEVVENSRDSAEFIPLDTAASLGQAACWLKA